MRVATGLPTTVEKRSALSRAASQLLVVVREHE